MSPNSGSAPRRIARYGILLVITISWSSRRTLTSVNSRSCWARHPRPSGLGSATPRHSQFSMSSGSITMQLLNLLRMMMKPCWSCRPLPSCDNHGGCPCTERRPRNNQPTDCGVIGLKFVGDTRHPQRRRVRDQRPRRLAHRRHRRARHRPVHHRRPRHTAPPPLRTRCPYGLLHRTNHRRRPFGLDVVARPDSLECQSSASSVRQ